MKVRCPECETVVEVRPGETPVCPTCGFGADLTPQRKHRAPDGALHRRIPLSGLAARIDALDWGRFLFGRSALKFASHGRLFTTATATFLRALAVLVVLGGVAGWLFLWRYAVAGDPFAPGGSTPMSILGGVLFQIAVLAAIYLIAHILIIRARHVSALPHAEFTVMPVASVTLRAFGEVAAAMVAVVGGLGVGLMTIIAGLPIGGQVFEGIGFLGGVTGNLVLGLGVIGTGLAVGTLLLAISYFVAEALVVAVTIAKHAGSTNEILGRLARSSQPDAPTEGVAEQVVVSPGAGRR